MTKQNIFLVIAAPIACAAILSLLFFVIGPALTKFESAENLESVEWLPPSAANISYARSYNRRLVEFDMSESDFLEWANDYPLAEITTPFSIRRYTLFSDELQERSSVDTAVDPRYTAKITNGLAGSERQKSGRGYSIAFDRDNGRGYFESSSR